MNEIDAKIAFHMNCLAILQNAKKQKFTHCQYCNSGTYIKTDMERMHHFGAGSHPCVWQCDNPKCRKAASELISQNLDKLNEILSH